MEVSRRRTSATIDFSPEDPVHMLETVPLPTFPVSVKEEPVGGRLANYWENWELLGADPWVVKVL